MTSDSNFFVKARWPARPESIDDCAERLKFFLGELGRVSPNSNAWYLKAASKPKAQISLVDTASEIQLVQALKMGVNRRDSDRSIIEELGWSLGLWNGCDNQNAISLNLLCGCYSEAVPNVCLLKYEAAMAQVFETAEKAFAVVRLMVETWDPASVVVTSNPLLDELENRGLEIKGYLPGWIVYLADYLGVQVNSTGIWSVERWFDRGTLVAFSERPPSVKNQDDMTQILSFAKNSLPRE